MIRWLNSISYILFISVVAICSGAAIAEEEATKDTSSELTKLEQKVKQGEQWLAHQVKRVLIYSHSNCDTCDHLKNELKKHNIEFQHVDLTWNHKQGMILSRKAGKEDVSYVFIGNEYVGNHKDLMNLLNQGKLREMLE